MRNAFIKELTQVAANRPDVMLLTGDLGFKVFDEFMQNPRPGEVYNAGGGRFSNCSILEAAEMCEKISGKKMNTDYTETNRIGDHIWYISDVGKFKAHYPRWNHTYDVEKILAEIFEFNKDRWKA